jgi:hypothetical protein
MKDPARDDNSEDFEPLQARMRWPLTVLFDADRNQLAMPQAGEAHIEECHHF